MSKHTPGPWEWRDGDDLRQAKSTRDDGRYGAQVIGAGYDYDRGPYLDMTDADRDLIAAAPDMLDALGGELHLSTARLLDWAADRMVNVYGESENVDFVQSIRKRAALCRAALQKAKGTP